MTNIIELFQEVKKRPTHTVLRQLQIVVMAMLAMTGRVTMLGISRWAGEGGSYRTIQRFFSSEIPWLELNWSLISRYLYKEGEELVIAGDGTTISKSGKASHGLGRYFSSIVNRPIKGLSFFSYSIVNVNRRCSFPMLMRQLTKVNQAASEETENKLCLLYTSPSPRDA